MLDPTSPFWHFIQSLSEHIVIDDEIVIAEQSRGVNRAFQQMLYSRATPPHFREHMTDQQRAIHIALLRLLQKHAIEKQMPLDDALGFAVTAGWYVLLSLDDTIVRTFPDENSPS